MSASFLFIGLMAGGLALLLFLIKKSPVGYQDETGFNFGYQNGFVLPQQNNGLFTNVKVAEKDQEQIEEEGPSPFVVFGFPLVKGFGLAALLISLVVLPKTLRNKDSIVTSSAHSHSSEQINVSSAEQISENQAETVLAVNARTESKLLPELCLRFSEVQ